MNKITRISFRVAAIGVLIASLSACAMSRTQAHAGIGAAAGGALGYVLTGGPIGTVAGAGSRRVDRGRRAIGRKFFALRTRASASG